MQAWIKKKKTIFMISLKQLTDHKNLNHMLLNKCVKIKKFSSLKTRQIPFWLLSKMLINLSMIFSINSHIYYRLLVSSGIPSITYIEPNNIQYILKMWHRWDVSAKTHFYTTNLKSLSHFVYYMFPFSTFNVDF